MYDMADGSAPFVGYDVTGAPIYDANGMPTVNTSSGYDDKKPWRDAIEIVISPDKKDTTEISVGIEHLRDPRLKATVLHHGAMWNGTAINVIFGQKDNPSGNPNATPTGYYLRKYVPEAILANNHAGAAKRLWTIIRYAEILLNYAEAWNEVNGPSSEVYDVLDQIRERAGITGSVTDRALPGGDLATQDAMRNFIHKERTIELVFEEHRPWDVRRWNCAVEALARPIYGVDVDKDGNITRKEVAKRVFDAKMYLYPLPEGEVWKTNLPNNPGW
jgi:hypothetical protein